MDKKQWNAGIGDEVSCVKSRHEWCRCGESRASQRIPPEAEAPKQEHEVVFLETFFDERRRKVPTGKNITRW